MSPIRCILPRSLVLTCSALPLFAATALVLTGCSSVKTNIEGEPVTAKTFSFIQPGSRLPTYVEERKAEHAMIQQAITKNLATKGLSLVPQGGDVIIAYLVIVGNNASTTSFSSYFGDSEDAAALLDKIHAEQTASDGNRNYFEAGTLVIDVVDPKTSKTLQRRSIKAQVLRSLTAETRAERIQAIVDQTLAGLRISQ